MIVSESKRKVSELYPFWQMAGRGPGGELETLCHRVKEQLVAVEPDTKLRGK